MRSLLITLILATAFIYFTSDSLPPVVASHFAAGGAANGFMPHPAYVRFMLVVVIALPLFIALMVGLTGALPARFINLPNRDYWLAPERQAETLDYLRRHGSHFGILLAVFFCFVHWLVIRANALQPAHFPEALFFGGMAAFVVALIIWLGSFVGHFRRCP
jgi:uncharacterized membrane protein